MTEPLIIEIAWPNADLSPNARVHHMALHRVKKTARNDAYWATKYVLPLSWKHDGTSEIILRQVAHPPDRRHYDRDNLDSRLKAARDGIADALGVNDRLLRPTGIEWGEPIRGGRILITVGES